MKMQMSLSPTVEAKPKMPNQLDKNTFGEAITAIVCLYKRGGIDHKEFQNLTRLAISSVVVKELEKPFSKIERVFLSESFSDRVFRVRK